MIDVLVVGGIFREILAFDTAPTERLGGSALTAATAARALGANVALAAAVGNEDAEEVRALLMDAGIEAFLSITSGRSGTFGYPTTESLEQPWPLYRPAEGKVTTSPDLPAADVLVLFGVPDLDPVAEGWVDRAARGARVLWDRQGWLSRARDDAHVLALHAENRIYVANLAEAIEDSGADESWTLAHQPPPGYAAAVIKRGTEGVLVYRSEEAERIEIPAFNVEAASTLASGDAFAGAVAAVLASGGELVEAAWTGCAVAAALIERGKNVVDGETVERARVLLDDRARSQ